MRPYGPERKYTRYNFVVSQNKSSAHVLYMIKEFFQCGSVHKAGGKMMEFAVGTNEDLIKHIIPFFDSHHFRTLHRQNQYLAFRNALLEGKTPLTHSVCPIQDSKQRKLCADWLAGLVDAEGCFYVAVFNSTATRIGKRVTPKFTLGFNEHNILKEIQEFTGCGHLRQRQDKF